MKCKPSCQSWTRGFYHCNCGNALVEIVAASPGVPALRDARFRVFVPPQDAWHVLGQLWHGGYTWSVIPPREK